MQNLTAHIVETISLKNALHGKKLQANFKKFGASHAQRADAFFKKYEALLHSQNKDINYAIECYLQMLADVNYETVQFIQTGEYSSKSFAEVNRRVYGNPEVMEYYMHGLLLSQFLWAHHYHVLLFFHDMIRKHAPHIHRYLEIGGGHGLYLSEAMNLIGDQATFELVDISRSSIEMTRAMTGISDLSCHLTDVYEYRPALGYDFITLGEVLEHVEQPRLLLKKIHGLLNEEGRLLITTPTNAPAIDHIYLFRNAAEIREIITEAGFETEDEFCVYAEDMPAEMAEKYKVSMMYAGVLKKRNA